MSFFSGLTKTIGLGGSAAKMESAVAKNSVIHSLDRAKLQAGARYADIGAAPKAAERIAPVGYRRPRRL